MITESHSEETRRARWWRTVAYLAVLLPVLSGVASVWMRPDFGGQEPLDWKPALALAEASRDKGDLYEARVLYSRAGRIASWREDWEGLLAVAWGIKRLDGVVRFYFSTQAILFRAMVAAETRRSRAGLSAVAKAFTAIGQPETASIVFSRMQAIWGEETGGFTAVDSEGCWGTTPEQKR